MKTSATAAILIAATLLFGTPVFAAETAPNPTGVAWITASLSKGAGIYWHAVTGWFTAIKDFVSGKGRTYESVGRACQESSDCPRGLACLNHCESGDCDEFSKRCAEGPPEIKILASYAECGEDTVCVGAAVCARTCPTGAECQVTHRCIPRAAETAACSEAAGCLEYCRAQGLPPIGFAAVKPECAAEQCRCRLEEVDPTLKRVACPAGAATDPIVCSPGTNVGCVAGGRLTCLTAPEFGGQCLGDVECGKANCPSGTAPFCDKDAVCRCRGSKETTLTCRQDSECGAINCAEGEIKLCSDGECACGRTVTTTKEISCATTSECPTSCAQGYERACVANKCACQRTGASAPITCQTVNDCGGAICPSGFEKKCLNALCACSRQVEQ